MKLLLTAICLFVASRSDAALTQERPDLETTLGFQGKWIEIHTPYGPIPARLLPGNAPRTVELIEQLAENEASRCQNCEFYRAESRPKPQQGTGPPYGLLQGRLDLPEIPPKEGNLEVKSGHLCMIPGTADFFIALSDHAEWGNGHTVFAQLADWLATDLIAAQDYDEIKHEQYGTIMRMMKKVVPFTVGPPYSETKRTKTLETE